MSVNIITCYNAAVPTKKKSGRGGKRPGTGPKPQPGYGKFFTKRVDIRLTPEQYEYLKETAEARSISVPEYIRYLVEQDRTYLPKTAVEKLDY